MTRQRIAHALLLAATLAAAAAGAPGVAHAHVAPSATENNRYLKLTLLPDRVRCAYTVFFGERPGAGERQRMDRDGSGMIDDAESARFGASLRDDVLGHLRVVVDDQPVPASAWKVEDVGLGTPATSGGAFAVDLLLYAPTRGAGAHSLTLEDGWIVPEPGESELVVEESPGVRVVAAHLLSAPGQNQARWTFRGNPDPPADRAARVEWTVDDAAYAEAAAATPVDPKVAPAHRSRLGLWIALAAGVVGTLASVIGLRKKKSPA